MDLHQPLKAGVRLSALQGLSVVSATLRLSAPQRAVAGWLERTSLQAAALAVVAAAGTVAGAVEGTAADKGQLQAPQGSAAAAAGRMMLATLPADTLPLNTHPGTQRSLAWLRARLLQDTARGAGLFTLCRRLTA